MRTVWARVGTEVLVCYARYRRVSGTFPAAFVRHNVRRPTRAYSDGIVMGRSLWSAIGLVGLLLMFLFGGAEALAQESETDLAKKTQNPVADLISIPFQNNTNFGIGPNDRTQNVLNVQPVIPVSLNSEWNLITRAIIPIINQPNLATSNDNTWGLGDVNVTVFLSPVNSGPITWGVGPGVQLPTGTDDATSTRKWTAGPSAVALTVQGPWVIGALVRQDWSFAGNSDRRSTSTALIQPFVNYNLSDGWYLTTSPIITADWEATNGNTWTVPVGGGFGKIQRIGKLPFNLSLAAYSNVVRPDLGADWTLRFSIALLLPKSIFNN